MTELVAADPCLLFALRRESRAFRRTFRPQDPFPGAPCWARFCGPAWLSVLVLETGVGADRTEVALRWVLGKPRLDQLPYQPRVLLSAGFAGALHPDYRVGDVILATEVVEPTGASWPTTWPGALPTGPWRPPLHRGRLLSSAHLIADPAEKEALGRTHDALAVDMESAGVARLCSQHGIPFGCVRVISDDVHTRLSPQLAFPLSDGRASPVRVAAALLRAPRLGGELWRLARDTRRAAEQLGQALGELLTLTLPFGAEL